MKQIIKYRTAVMGFAALWIMFFHEGMVLYFSNPLLYNLERFVKKTGFAGVDIFLLLSGMGLVYAIQKESIPYFYYR